MLMQGDTGWTDFGAYLGGAVRVDICGDKENADICIPWKYAWTMKDTWLGAESKLGSIGSLYNLALDPYEKYDMTFNGLRRRACPSPRPAITRGRTTDGC